MTDALDSKDIISGLNDLIELDHDAAAAYESAIEKIEEQGLKNQLSAFLNDHNEHIDALSQHVREEGGEPSKGADMKKLLTTGKVAIAELGGDDAILKAMVANEEVTNKSYDTEVSKNYPPHIQSTLEKNLADERRHREWLKTKHEAIED